MADWSNLQDDMLTYITNFLPLPDRHRFSAVCHSWRSAAKQKPQNSLPPQLPWLILGEDPTTKKRNFFNLSEQKPYSIDIPELYGQHVCGSSYGWLFIMDRRIKLSLLNPFTRECIELPPLPSFSHTRTVIITEEPNFNSEGKRVGYTFEFMQKLMVGKAILSHDPKEKSDFVAMILFGEYHLLAIWRPGDITWRVVKYPPPPNEIVYICDMICFQGTFYAVSSLHEFFVVDVGFDPMIRKIKPSIPSFKKIAIDKYFVEFKGELLLLLRFRKYKRKTGEFWVFRLDVKKGRWEEIDDIDNLAFFVGNNSGMVVDPSMFHGCVENGIYFSDMCDYLYWRKKHDFGVYDMVDETMGRFCLIDEAFLRSDAPLIWLMPNLNTVD